VKPLPFTSTRALGDSRNSTITHLRLESLDGLVKLRRVVHSSRSGSAPRVPEVCVRGALQLKLAGQSGRRASQHLVQDVEGALAGIVAHYARLLEQVGLGNRGWDGSGRGSQSGVIGKGHGGLGLPEERTWREACGGRAETPTLAVPTVRPALV
jgi:hypothetical protein